MRLTIGILIIFLMILGGCAGDENQIGGSGLIEADEVLVSAETSGRVMWLYFAEGQPVNSGDTLAVIDPSRATLELASARAGRKVAEGKLIVAEVSVQQAEETLTFAKSELDRVTRLLNSGTATRKQFDAINYEHAQAELGLSAAKANIATIKAEIARIDSDIANLERRLEDFYPLAPVSGVALDKYVDRGELLTPGKPIVKIARMDTVWVKVYLAAPEFAGVKLGDKARVDTESGGTVYDGEVVWTSDQAEFTPKNVQTSQSRADLVYAVKVRIGNPDGQLKIGMPVYISLGQK